MRWPHGGRTWEDVQSLSQCKQIPIMVNRNQKAIQHLTYPCLLGMVKGNLLKDTFWKMLAFLNTKCHRVIWLEIKKIFTRLWTWMMWIICHPFPRCPAISPVVDASALQVVLDIIMAEEMGKDFSFLLSRHVPDQLHRCAWANKYSTINEH